MTNESNIEPKLGNIADLYMVETRERLCKSELDSGVQIAFEILQEETYKALRLLENEICKLK